MRRGLILWILLVAISPMTEPWVDAIMDRQARAAGFDRPYGPPHQGRSVVLARQGMVATSHPAAAQAGLDVLRAGGNAADAAIAANAMLCVVEPMSCGVGGDLFAIYWDSKTKTLSGLNASGKSPLAISRQVFADRELAQIPDEGPLSWSVPGCVSGWDELRRRFGTQPLAQLLQPAVTTAEEGFAVSEIIAGAWNASAAQLRGWPDSAATFLVDGQRAPAFGEVFRNPRLARTLSIIGERGPEAFYRGPIAEQIVAFSEANGGYFSLRDFEQHRAEWVEPVSTDYRGYTVWELPPNGQGLAVLQMLNVLKQFDLRTMGPGSADYLHLLIESKKLAFADRARFYSDPEFNAIPVSELISDAYAKRQAARIQMDAAATDVPAGDPRLMHGDTVYVTVVDKDRNCCSLIQSTYHGFGSKVTPGDLGFTLQNRGALFALQDDHFNRLEPGKRPFHTIIPALVTRDGKPWFCFGVMGGDMQPQGHVQVLVNLIDFDMNVQAAGDAARVRHLGSATPTGLAAEGAGTVLVESGIPAATVEALRARGHQVLPARSGFGGYQGIRIDGERGVLFGGSESRKDGAALGY